MVSPINVLPKPIVKPCTLPNTRLTVAVPATTPVATGKKAMSKALGDAKANSSKQPITMPPTIDRWIASPLIWSRLCTENTGAPLSRSRGLAPVMSRVAASKADCTLAMAMVSASRSLPGACVVASNTARGAEREVHTPASVRGALAGIRLSATPWVSPVGSRSSNGLTKLPAGVPSSDSVSAIAS